MSNNNLNALPLSIRDISPYPNAVKLTGISPSGLPSGVHTGGAWLLDNRVWKPLDARPYANCEYHYPTREAECLEFMAGKPLFPHNWWVENRNGRNWLVRKKAHIIPDDFGYKEIFTTLDKILLVEAGVRKLNRNKWEIGDTIALAIDPDTYDLFLYDLSTAHPQDGMGCYRADEEWRIYEFFKRCKAERLLKLRENAHHVVSNLDFLLEHGNEYRHVYASFNRPVSPVWADIPGEPKFIHEEWADLAKSVPHTWVIVKEPLPDDMLKRYELQWGWSPIHATDVAVREGI